MNNFLKSVLLVAMSLFVVSCSSDSTSTEPLRDYATQYATDIDNIETFMKTHYMEVVNNPGGADDQNVTYTKIPAGGTQVSIWDQTTYPVQTLLVDKNDITYKLYYIQLRQGSGTNSKSPCNVDRVLTSYRGEYIYTGTEGTNDVILSKEFEELVNPQSYFNLTGVVSGWGEVFPKFKTGSYVGNTDGTLSYFDFGAGIMFLPSGLAYYSSGAGGIPSYSPLIFNFKLYEISRTDLDSDGIDSYLEDLNGDGYVRTLASGVVNPDDTDGDEIPDFLDIDDDGDYFTTKSEINNPITNNPFPFADIPLCTDGKKKHLSNVCH